MGFLVGAYAIAPAALDDEEALLAGLAARADVRGLELPFTGALHRSDEPWLLARLRPDWDHVVTLIPGTMGRLQADSRSRPASRTNACVVPASATSLPTSSRLRSSSQRPHRSRHGPWTWCRRRRGGP